ncbi:MAG: alkaline phosphatase family protein [Caulobacteraceae bacterium]
MAFTRRSAPIALVVIVALAAVVWWAVAHHRPHNVLIFVADGLRSEIVDDTTAPALAAVRREGVDFTNSHAVFPTLTTVNAAAFATGHRPGDTGDFSNIVGVTGQPLPFPIGSFVVPFEDDDALGLMNQRFGGNYLDEVSLIQAAREHGFSTAAVGKLGPTAIQNVTARDGMGTIVIDDSTGYHDTDFTGVPLSPEVAGAMKKAGLDLIAPDRGLNSDAGAYNRSGVRVANKVQQDWFVDAAAKVVLPMFKQRGKPFVMVFWSRDPDGTQHNQGDSLNTLTPGINGPTSLAAIRNASDDLQRLRDTLKALGLDKTTDIVVVADHGFSVASKQSATSAAAKITYRDVVPGYLPPGFMAIDLSKALGLPLYDQLGLDISLAGGFHPKDGALVGADPKRPDLIIGSNGGSDLIYLPNPNARTLAPRVVAALLAQDYVGAVFVDDALGAIPGTLPLSAIGLKGKALPPTPSIVVSFRSYSLGCQRPELCAVDIADTTLQQGQGIHGSFSRADTHNFMAAVGPDFKAGYVDRAPAGNQDIPITLAKALRLPLPSKGPLVGRVLSESLKGRQDIAAIRGVKRSAPAANGFTTVLSFQSAGGRDYYDAAGMPGRVMGLTP